MGEGEKGKREGREREREGKRKRGRGERRGREGGGESGGGRERRDGEEERGGGTGVDKGRGIIVQFFFPLKYISTYIVRERRTKIFKSPLQNNSYIQKIG